MSVYDMLIAGYAVEGYTITTAEATIVDNEGEPCDRCQTEGHDVTHTVYGVMNNGPMSGLCVTLDCCTDCVVPIIKTMDPFADVRVEFAAFAVLTEVVDTLNTMCGPDCTCLHPDAV